MLRQLNKDAMMDFFSTFLNTISFADWEEYSDSREEIWYNNYKY